MKRVFGDVTAGQLVDGLDKTYADYRNIQLDAREVIPIVAQSTKGKTDAEIAEMLEKARERNAKK